MAQFRFTSAFAQALEIPDIISGIEESPLPTPSPLDDWCLDTMICQSQVIVIATHLKSWLTFVLPDKLIGHPVEALGCIPLLLRGFLQAHALPDELIQQIPTVFMEMPHLCHNDNPEVLKHLKKFKRCLLTLIKQNGLPTSKKDWHLLLDHLLVNPDVNGTLSIVRASMESALHWFSGSKTH